MPYIIYRQNSIFIKLNHYISLIAKAFSGNDADCVAVVRIKDDSSIPDWEAKDAETAKRSNGN